MKGFTATTLLMLCMPLAALANEPLEVEDYRYGMDLDIKQVISVKSEQPDNFSSNCVPVKEEMIYKDSQGHEHDLKYQVMSTDCNNG